MRGKKFITISYQSTLETTIQEAAILIKENLQPLPGFGIELINHFVVLWLYRHFAR